MLAIVLCSVLVIVAVLVATRTNQTVAARWLRVGLIVLLALIAILFEYLLGAILVIVAVLVATRTNRTVAARWLRVGLIVLLGFLAVALGVFYWLVFTLPLTR